MSGGKDIRANCGAGSTALADESARARNSANGLLYLRTHKILIFIIFLFLAGNVFALNPRISDVNYNQFYAGRDGSITVTVVPETTNGYLEFYEGTNIIQRRAYDFSTTTLNFTRNYSNPSDQNITFALADINGENTNLLDDKNNFLLHVKKGIDLEVTNLNTTPTKVEPNSTARISIVITNVGDESSTQPAALQLYFGTTLLNTINILDFNIGQQKTFQFDWTPPSDFNSGTIRAYINNGSLFPEFSLTNNEKVYTLITTDLANLIAKQIQVGDSLRKNFLETITLVVDNNGSRNVDSAYLEVYINNTDVNNKIYSNTISISQHSTKSIDFVYSFSEIKKYNLLFYVNRNQTTQESNYNDNSFTKEVSVYDFNLQSILKENEDLRQQLIIAQAKYDGADSEKASCLSSLSNQRSLNESCTSDLAICNSNNSTKISNYMVQMDANREAEKTIYLGEINRLGQEKSALKQSYDVQIASVTDEKNQWAMLVMVFLVCVIGFIIYEQYYKNKPKKAIGLSG